MKCRVWCLLSMTMIISLLILGCSDSKKESSTSQLQQSGSSSTASSNNGQQNSGSQSGGSGGSNSSGGSGLSGSTGNSSSSSSSGASNSKLGNFFGTFQLAVPGVSYTTENNANNTITVHSSAGVQSGGIKINADGTYIWNSTWDEKVINGKWKETGDSEYPILIIKGEEGKDWKLGKSAQSGSDITVWDGNSIWKNGKKSS